MTERARLFTLIVACSLAAACQSDHGLDQPDPPADDGPANDTPDRDFVGEPAERPAPPRAAN